jgi:hypothetical protein
VNTVAGGTFIGLLFLIWIAVLILPTVFFILTQQRALSKCSPANRTMSPGLAWLQIIPVFGFIWQFFVVSALANSLGNEFRARGIQEEERPGYGVGLAMCITRICVVIPILGFFSLVASLILWIVYWVKIAGFSAKLDFAPGARFAPAPYGGGYYGPGTTGTAPYQSSPGAVPHTSEQSSAGSRSCATCGASVPAGQAFCNQCGAKV